MDKFVQETRALLGFQLTTRQITAFQRYEAELLEWNARMNLTAIRDPTGIRSKHFLDSLTCLPVLFEKPPQSLIDIGTGAGFPGIHLKIMLPKMRLTLVESVGKKLDFCRHVVNILELEEVAYFQARAEELGQQRGQREHYDCAVARAVADMPVLAEYLLPLVKIGGLVVAQKGGSAHAEAQRAEKAFQILGGRLRQVLPVEVPGVAEERFLVLVEKIAPTPSGYPRRTGLPAKRPIA